MDQKEIPKTCCPIFAVVALLLATMVPSYSAPQQFTIDPSQTSLTLSGTVLGTAITEQQPMSLTTVFDGNVNADVGASTIQFTGGSSIDARTNGVWSPAVGGATGSAPGDFGGGVNLGTLLGSGQAALRNIIVDATSGAIPVAGGTFDSSGLVFSFPTGSSAVFDYSTVGLLGTQHGSKALAANGTNKVSTLSTLVNDGTKTTITLPIDTEFVLQLLTPGDTHLFLKGQLVATSGGGGGPAAPSFGSIVVSNQVVTVTWASNPGDIYQLENTTNLSAWNPLVSNIVATAATTTFTTNTTGDLEFFRLKK